MQPSRPKKRFLPTVETAERRDLPSAASLGVISAHATGQMHVSVGTLSHHVEQYDHDMTAHSVDSSTHASTLRAYDRLPSASVSPTQQSQLADDCLQLANVVLHSLLKREAASASAPVRKAIRQVHYELVHNPTGAAQAAASHFIDSILSAIGPGDPFASAPVISESDLEPGDIIATCTPSLVSQALELGCWSRYSHVALYIGNDQIIDSTGTGVHVRSLSDLLAPSNRVGVLRIPNLTANEAQTAIQAAEAHEGAAYNYTGVGAIALQKIASVISDANQGLGGIIGVLTRAEHIPASFVHNGTYWCSQLVLNAFESAGINPTYANGVSAGDMVRLGSLGVFDEVGRLALPTPTSATVTGVWLP